MLNANGFSLRGALQTSEKTERCDCPVEGCSSIGYQYANVSVPIQIRPNAIIGTIETECCAEPTVLCKENKCTNCCEVVLMQKICIKIPIQYSVDVVADESKIDCCCIDGCCESPS